MKTHTPTTHLTSLRTQHTVVFDELERYKLLVESIEDYAIFMMDPKGYIQTWNKGAQKNKGYAAHEIIGKHFSKFYTEIDMASKKPERELELAQKFGRVEDEDWRVRKDGSKFWANVVITALYDNGGNLVGFAKVTRDLTDRKKQEDSMRTANLTLKEQQKKLEALNTSKDEFVSLASHQLRTPATAIKNLLAILLEGFSGPLEAAHRELISKAYASNERQLAIVESLLKVAQVDAGKVVLNKTPTDIKTLLYGILEDQSDAINERGQTCKLTMDSSLSDKIVIDENNIRMALENLIDNASKYTPHGGKIILRAGEKDNQIDISIQDTGVGIASKDMDKLFERFSRIPNDMSGGVVGSGLGLYWADKIIGLHGGHIEVDSKVNEGTTFHVLHPRVTPGA